MENTVQGVKLNIKPTEVTQKAAPAAPLTLESIAQKANEEAKAHAEAQVQQILRKGIAKAILDYAERVGNNALLVVVQDPYARTKVGRESFLSMTETLKQYPEVGEVALAFAVTRNGHKGNFPIFAVGQVNKQLQLHLTPFDFEPGTPARMCLDFLRQKDAPKLVVELINELRQMRADLIERTVRNEKEDKANMVKIFKKETWIAKKLDATSTDDTVQDLVEEVMDMFEELHNSNNIKTFLLSKRGK